GAAPFIALGHLPEVLRVCGPCREGPTATGDQILPTMRVSFQVAPMLRGVVLVQAQEIRGESLRALPLRNDIGAHVIQGHRVPCPLQQTGTVCLTELPTFPRTKCLKKELLILAHGPGYGLPTPSAPW